MACWEWGKYLGDEALSSGVDVCISSWNRIAPNTLPALSKAAGNYMNSQLIRMEADVNGYAEGIALDQQGYISEGSGENIFVIRDGKMLTPPLGASVLPGITRDSVLKLAQALEIPIIKVGQGHRGPITERLQKEFFGIVNGTSADRFGWLTPVKSRELAGVRQ
jgi:branched-chain amino acid aminotransferase